MAASIQQKEHVIDRVAKVFRAISRAAEAGLPCPKNAELVALTGCRSTSTIADDLHFLEAAGMVRVERSTNHRVVTICATGEKTAGVPGRPHWSAKRRAAI